MPRDGATMPEQYHANKYASRSPVTYVASLYRDQPFDSEAGEGCACGYSDPLHAHDTKAGWVPLVGAIGSGAASDFEGFRSTSAHLNALSCDASKRLAVALSSSSPPMLREEVDALGARRRPPPLGWNDSQGQSRHEDFEEWLQSKERLALQAEAERKRRAVAELSAQIHRRAQATQAFEAWKEDKARTPTSASRASSSAGRAAAAAAASVSPAAIAEKDARRTATFELWRSSKDSALLSSVRAERTAASAATERARLDRESAAAQSQESFARWVLSKSQRDSARRAALAAEHARKTKEDLEAQRSRDTKTKEQLDAWNKDKLALYAKQHQAQLAHQRKQQEAADKRKKEVVETQAAREHRLASHLQHLLRERAKKEAAEAREKKAAHKEAWKKKEAGPVAYSTIKSQAHVFR